MNILYHDSYRWSIVTKTWSSASSRFEFDKSLALVSTIKMKIFLSLRRSNFGISYTAIRVYSSSIKRAVKVRTAVHRARQFRKAQVMAPTGRHWRFTQSLKQVLPPWSAAFFRPQKSRHLSRTGRYVFQRGFKRNLICAEFCDSIWQHYRVVYWSDLRKVETQSAWGN